MYSMRHVLPPMEQALNPIRNGWLPFPNICVAIAPMGMFFATLVMTVVHIAHNWTEVLKIPPSGILEAEQC